MGKQLETRIINLEEALATREARLVTVDTRGLGALDRARELAQARRLAGARGTVISFSRFDETEVVEANGRLLVAVRMNLDEL